MTKEAIKKSDCTCSDLPEGYSSINGHKIIDIRSDGKWLEFWFQDGEFDATRYDETCKSYMLTEVIEAAGLSSHVWKNGLLGIWLNWRDDRPVSAAINLTDLKCCKLAKTSLP